MRSALALGTLVSSLSCGFLFAQEQNIEVAPLSTGLSLLSWNGQPGRSYFLQVSDPNSHLEKWFWAPVIEGGQGADISYEVDSTADKGFFRLRYTDQPLTFGKTLDTDDFDKDGLSNLAEISADIGQKTDPLKSDTDGDGMNDGFERLYGFNANNADADGNGIPDGLDDADFDGISNNGEALYRTNPLSASSHPPRFYLAERRMSESLGLNEVWREIATFWNGSSHTEYISNGSFLGTPEISNYFAQSHPFPSVPPADSELSIYLGLPSPNQSLLTENETEFARHANLDSTDARYWLEVSSDLTSDGPYSYNRLVISESSLNIPADESYLDATKRVARIELMDFVVPQGETVSAPVDIIPAHLPTGVSSYVDRLDFYLPEFERAPESVPVNSDFDEGRIDPVTGYAIPDCDDADVALEAQRDHLNGKYVKDERITDDMHEGFFGLRPNANVPPEFYTGANVTITKIDKIDPATGFPESGHIRFYAKWGEDAGQYVAILPYDFDTLIPVNLAYEGLNGYGSVYGIPQRIPNGATFYMEGVHPGKITLEWRYQKGSIDFKHEQTFEVCTHQSASQWKAELAYKIRLETSNDPSGEVNVQLLHFPSESYKERMERISEYYDFYADCFLTPMRSKPLHPQAMTWPGLARLAGSQVVGGLSDSEYARRLLKFGTIANVIIPEELENKLLTWSLSETETLQQALFIGARNIFKSIGWQMHAYRSSGYRALDWVETATGEAEVSALSGVWRDLRIGILSHDKSLLDGVAEAITEREQNITIVPTWAIISGLFAGTTDWMFSVLGKNSSTPSGFDFSDFFPQFPSPTGSLPNTADRWTWIKPTTIGGILDTWNYEPVARRELLVGRYLEEDARRFSLISHFGSPAPLLVIPLPVWVWDHEDVK